MIYMLSAARVIGIVVLVIVIVVVVLILFPITYRLDVNVGDRKGKLKIYWIFRLFRFRFGIDEDLELALAVLFFEIDFLDEDRRRLRRKRRGQEIEEEEKERSTMQRVAGFARSSIRFFNLVREYELFQEAWPLLMLLLFHSRPRNVSGHVEFGMSDPARTGEITGAVAAIPAIYRTDLIVTPDFETEETYARGEIHAKGHVMMIHALIFLIRMLRNEKIRAFIGALRHRE